MQSLLGLVACDGNGDADAGDARADAARDSGNNDPDMGFPDDVVTAEDVVTTDASDASTDASTCPATNPFDAVNYWAYKNRIMFWRSDNSAAPGGTNPNNSAFIFAKAVDAPAPTERVGDCVYYPVRLGGSVARNDAPSLNFGTLVATQPGTAWTWTVNYDNTMMSYVPVGQPTGFLEPGRTVNLTLAGGPNGAAASVMAMFPGPAIENTGINRGVASRSREMVISLTVPHTDLPADVAMYMIGLDAMNGFSNAIVCAVPACRGRITVPASMMAHYTSGSIMAVRVGIERQVPIPGADGGTSQTVFVTNSSAVQPTPVVD